MANRFDYRGGEHEVWLERVEEPILEPDLPIVDAHHHLWIRGDAPYLLREFAADLQRGHRVVATVFAECHSMYRTSGPEALRSVGEMEFVAGIAAMSDAGAFGSPGVCRAAVGGVDLTLGSAVEPVLDALTTASGGRFRGVRASVCWDASEALHRAAPRAGFFSEPAVRAGIAVLARRGLSLDCWLYHPQTRRADRRGGRVSDAHDHPEPHRHADSRRAVSRSSRRRPARLARRDDRPRAARQRLREARRAAGEVRAARTRNARCRRVRKTSRPRGGRGSSRASNCSARAAACSSRTSRSTRTGCRIRSCGTHSSDSRRTRRATRRPNCSPERRSARIGSRASRSRTLPAIERSHCRKVDRP